MTNIGHDKQANTGTSKVGEAEKTTKNKCNSPKVHHPEEL